MRMEMVSVILLEIMTMMEYPIARTQIGQNLKMEPDTKSEMGLIQTRTGLEAEKGIKAETPGSGSLSGRAREALEVVYVMAPDLRAEAIEVVVANPCKKERISPFSMRGRGVASSPFYRRKK